MIVYHSKTNMTLLKACKIGVSYTAFYRYKFGRDFSPVFGCACAQIGRLLSVLVVCDLVPVSACSLAHRVLLPVGRVIIVFLYH